MSQGYDPVALSYLPVSWGALSLHWNLMGSSVCRSDVALSSKSIMIPAAKQDLFVGWSCGLSALSLLSFLCPIVSSSSVGSIFYLSMCILKLSGNQLIFNSCSNVKGSSATEQLIKDTDITFTRGILYLHEKKGQCHRNGGGIFTSI